VLSLAAAVVLARALGPAGRGQLAVLQSLAGSVFTTAFYPRLAEHGVTYANSLPGELFLNFGWSGVGGGMFLFGLILGLLEGYKRERGRRIGPLLVYAYLIVPAAGSCEGTSQRSSDFLRWPSCRS